jgi:glycosyltransferase involved in cell wall biosynthesis
MKLLIYAHFFLPSVGGVEHSVLALASGLAELRLPDGQREFQVTVVTNSARGEFREQGLPFQVVRRPGLRDLYQLMRSADVIHVTGPSVLPMMMARWMGKAYVVEHHGYQAICPNGLLVHQPDRDVCPGHFVPGRYRECFDCVSHENSTLASAKRLAVMGMRLWLARRATVNLAVSRHVMARQALPHSETIYHGIEIANLTMADLTGAERENSKPRFAYVGRFVPEKGISILLRAAGLLAKEGRDFELLLVGDGTLRTEIEQEIEREGIRERVTITGFLERAEVGAALKGVLAVVVPSVWEEAAGLSAMEQMMRGRLVIASDIGGLGEMVGEGGLTFPPGNANALAERMRRVLENPVLVKDVGSRARLRALEFFQSQRMIEEHAKVYRRVMHNSRAETK